MAALSETEIKVVVYTILCTYAFSKIYSVRYFVDLDLFQMKTHHIVDAT